MKQVPFLDPLDTFAPRHIGPRGDDVAAMLKAVGAESLDTLIDEAIPASIRLDGPLDLPAAESESAYLSRLKTIAKKNKVFRSFIGLGYSDTLTPSVIRRCVFENPGWYTPYTPYQAEIAQGRLESLLNFQTMVTDLTGMAVANASLLDEGTAAGEAMALLHRVQSKKLGDAERRVPRVGSLLPADHRGAAKPRGAARHRAARRPRGCDGVRRRCVRRPRAVSGRSRPPRRPAPVHQEGARRGCARGGGHRSAGARARHLAGRDGRRRRVRQFAALRRAARFRRSARARSSRPARTTCATCPAA